MQMSQKKTPTKINSYEATAIISNTMLGAGLLSLPRTLTAKANSPDGWIVLMLEGLIFIFLIFLNTKIIQKHQYESYFDYVQEGFGRFLGSLLNLGITGYFIGVASFEARAMAEMMKFFLLENTPIQVILLSFIFCGIYLMIGGMSDISRLFPFFLTVTIIILLIVFAFSLQIFDINNMRPVLGQGMSSVVNSLTIVSVSFLGVEVMLFLPKYMKKRKQMFKSSAIGFSIPIFLYIITYVIVVGSLSVPEVVSIIWPTITLFQSFETKGLFVERFESFLLIVWIIQFFTTYVMYTFFAASGLKKVFRSSNKTGIFIISVVTFFISLWPKDANQVMAFSDYLGYVFLGLFVMPFVTFLLVALKRRLKAQ